MHIGISVCQSLDHCSNGILRPLRRSISINCSGGLGQTPRSKPTPIPQQQPYRKHPNHPVLASLFPRNHKIEEGRIRGYTPNSRRSGSRPSPWLLKQTVVSNFLTTYSLPENNKITCLQITRLTNCIIKCVLLCAKHYSFLVSILPPRQNNCVGDDLLFSTQRKC